MKNSIQGLLILSFLGLAIIPLLLLSLFLTWQSFNVELEQTIAIHQGIAQNAALEVEQFITEQETALSLVTEVLGLEDLASEHHDSALSRLQSYNHTFQELILLDSDGDELIRISRLISFDADELGNRAAQDEFSIPMASRETYYSPIRFDDETDEPFMTISVPVINIQTGLVENVLLADIRLKDIQDVISQIRIGDEGIAYIINTDTQVVAHRNPSIVLRGTVFDIPLQDGIYRGLSGELAVLATHTLNINNQTLFIVAESPMLEALASSILALIITAIALIITFIIASSLGFVIIRQITRPIEALVNTSQLIASGDLTQRIAYNRKDEFGVLATTFNLMVEQVGLLINNERELTSELTNLNDSLDKHVKARTSELETSNRELDAFAYSVSHDLRSPLRAIIGFSQAIQEDYQDVLDEDGHEYLTDIIHAGKKMNDLISDMLHLSRVTRTEINRDTVDLSALAQDIIYDLAQSEPERQVSVNIQDNITAFADKGLLSIVLDNLLGNAWKFTGKTEQQQIDFFTEEQDGQIVYVIRDNGAGFDMSYTDKLFGAFQRLHHESEFKGTGIGLATVQRVINKHQGHIWADAKPNQGATFHFTLSINSQEVIVK